MKTKLKMTVSIMLAMMLILSTVTFSVSASAATKLTYNDGVRHEVCTSFSKNADDYYSGKYSFETLKLLEGNDSGSSLEAMESELFESLSNLMSDTQSYNPKYSGYTKNSLAYYWEYTDAADGEPGYYYFYTDCKKNDKYTMNREHVWAKSNASFYQKNGGSDLHHLRPAVDYVNSSRSNYMFGNVKGVLKNYDTSVANDTDVIWYSKADNLVEVADNVKGDVARIIMYVYVRWQQPNLLEQVTSRNLPELDADDSQNDGKPIFESLDTLLEWMEQDPVDTWEMGRNDIVEQIQGNRNVFIDYPELAWMLFDEPIPNDMQTPSGYALTCGDTEVGCKHDYHVSSQSATCTTNGYNKYECQNCNYSYVEKIHAIGHTFECVDEDFNIYYCNVCHKYEIIKYLYSTKTLNDGDSIVIYCPGVNKAMGSTPTEKQRMKSILTKLNSDGSLTLSDEMALFTVIENDDGTYSFIGQGMYLTCPEKGNGLYLSDRDDDYTKWYIEEAGHDLFYIVNLSARYVNGQEQTQLRYIECYDDFTSYGMNEKQHSLFLMQFYGIDESECSDKNHKCVSISNNDGTHNCVCKECGHTENEECIYEDNICIACGYERSEFIPPVSTDDKAMYGDVNCDNTVTLEDVTLLQKILASLASYDDYGKASKKNADCSHDGYVTMLDVTTIQKYLANIIKSFE
ncbi:MAG: endonuclease [Clostridia bacterium]|nr:endonuclease [Clostridia bacterium]